ncbi:MAG: ROK family transcriptional regulator [Microbacteriaceae bacterium]|nr:ROK family transcriptional regulator [Microbacteriaceae bacterium]
MAIGSNRLATGRALRPTAKVLPEHAREHNRSLVLQTLYSTSGMSRADVARETGLTRVTVSDLVAQLIAEGLVVETGQREDSRPGKPATLIDIARDSHQIIGVDLSDHAVLRGAVLNLDGETIVHQELPLEGAQGAAATAKVTALLQTLQAKATRPVLGVGVGTPGVVDLDGNVLLAPNLGWKDEPLRRTLAEASGGLPIVVANDANVAALAEHGFGDADGDTLVVTIGHGVGAGLVLHGIAVYGSRFAAGEIGHVTVGTDQGPLCACGKHGCLETWLAVPRLTAALAAAAGDAERSAILTEAGARLGIALAPVVGALDLSEVVLAGPSELIDGPLIDAVADTLRERTLPDFHGHVGLRRSGLGPDIVIRGAAVMVLSARLGVS